MYKLCLLLLFCVVLFKATGQPGSLDSTFGNNGIQTTAFNTANTLGESGRVVLISTNGDIFVVISVTSIVKYLPDGRLDSSYGDVGYSNRVSIISTSAIFQGDKIIVAGSADNPVDHNQDFALVRYTSNGRLDSSFGEHGKVTTDFNNYQDEANSIALQGDKIIIGGSTYDLVNNTSDFALVRYTANGGLDSSFGEHGKVITDFNNSYDAANSITLQGAKIIVVGYTYNYSGADFALARYTEGGALDSSFGVNGKVTTDFYGRDDYAHSMTLQGDKIIVAGNTENYQDYDYALARYTAGGMLDSSFGENGKVITNFYGSLYDVALQEDKIIVVGDTDVGDNPSPDYVLARYTADGALDASFGENGILISYFPTSQTFFTSTAIQGNKIIATGYVLKNSIYFPNYDFALARYAADGRLDSSFGKNGKVTTDFNTPYDISNSMTLQGDKIIVAGYTYNSFGPNYDFCLARYTADGILDSSFGEYGRVATGFHIDDVVNSIVLQGDKILIAGYTRDSHYNSNLALARYTADGVLDSSFGRNGKVTTDFNGNYDGASAIALQGNKIVVAGYADNHFNFTHDFALARYTSNGRLDSSFGKNGKVTTDFNGLDDYAYSIALQGDKIILAGYTDDYPKSDFALARYTSNGRLDSSFGKNGIVTTDFNNSIDRAYSIALQGDKIIVAGSADNSVAFNTDFALARYTAHGTLDSSFGEHGKVTTNLGGSAIVRALALYENRLYAVGTLRLSTNGTDETYGAVAAYQLETPEPAISMSIGDETVSESRKLAVVTVHLSASANRWVRINYAIHNKTAMSSQDYLHVKGTLLFIPGVNTTAKVFIPIVDDNRKEGAEQFEVYLSNASNATITDSIGVVTILDDDALITKQATSLHINASPNPSVDGFTIQLQGSSYKQQVIVRVFDVSGRLIEEKKNISIGQILHLGDQYKAGTYIIEALQGSQSVQTKVIKTGK